MQYEMKRPTTEAEAIEIIDGALRVIYGQIEVYRGVRKKAWNGDFVDHLRTEAVHSLAWLADRYPKLMTAEPDQPVSNCDCDFSAEVCKTNPCMRKKMATSGLAPEAKYPHLGVSAISNGVREVGS